MLKRGELILAFYKCVKRLFDLVVAENRVGRGDV